MKRKVAPLHVVDIKNSVKKKSTSTGNTQYLSGEELIKKASVDFTGADTPREKLERQLKMLEELIPIAEGLYRTKPNQSSCYSLSNLVSQTNETMAQLAEMVNYDELAENIYNSIFVNFVEDIIKIMGVYIKQTNDLLAVDKDPETVKKIERGLTSLYRKFGKTCEDKVSATRKQIKESIVSSI